MLGGRVMTCRRSSGLSSSRGRNSSRPSSAASSTNSNRCRQPGRRCPDVRGGSRLGLADAACTGRSTSMCPRCRTRSHLGYRPSGSRRALALLRPSQRQDTELALKRHTDYAGSEYLVGRSADAVASGPGSPTPRREPPHHRAPSSRAVMPTAPPGEHNRFTWRGRRLRSCLPKDQQDPAVPSRGTAGPSVMSCAASEGSTWAPPNPSTTTRVRRRRGRLRCHPGSTCRTGANGRNLRHRRLRRDLRPRSAVDRDPCAGTRPCRSG